MIKNSLFLIVALFFSCNNTTKTTVKQQKTQQQKIKLWQANDATTKAINAMKIVLNDFGVQDNNDAYVSLQNKLVDQFNSILTNCTMEGEAHNHLHEYLVPMKQKIDAISSDNTLEENQKIIASYKDYLKKYNTVFK